MHAVIEVADNIKPTNMAELHIHVRVVVESCAKWHTRRCGSYKGVTMSRDGTFSRHIIMTTETVTQIRGWII